LVGTITLTMQHGLMNVHIHLFKHIDATINLFISNMNHDMMYLLSYQSTLLVALMNAILLMKVKQNRVDRIYN